MTFEQYWEKFGFKTNPPIMEEAFKEVSRKAFDAGYEEGYDEGYERARSMYEDSNG